MGIPLERTGPLGPADLNALLAAAEGKDAIVIGPGIPRGAETAALIGDLIERLEMPMVLDADALNAVAADVGTLRRAKRPLVLTPHPGEMARLTGLTTKEVQANRLGVARDFSMQHGMTLVLKGARTIVTSAEGELFVNPTGNPGMATAGAGDVLSGVCGAFLAQGIRMPDAAWAAAYAHGLAGDLAATRRGKVGLIAGDIVESLCEVWTRWGR
jgi:NAD(P)H-hydrate epimerase